MDFADFPCLKEITCKTDFAFILYIYIFFLSLSVSFFLQYGKMYSELLHVRYTLSHRLAVVALFEKMAVFVEDRNDFLAVFFEITWSF